MIDRDTYQLLLDTHGRRVANRAAVSEMPIDQRGLTLFYEMYASETCLPEAERCKSGLIYQFDPAGWRDLYADHPRKETGVMYGSTNGASAYWFDQLQSARQWFGDWVLSFIYVSLVTGEPNEAFDSIVDDQGEFRSEDGLRYCAWWSGWFGWTAWGLSLSSDDERALTQVLSWLFSTKQPIPRHPEPGSPEAEAFLEANKLFGVE